jgi:hypothetical protein
LVLRVLLSCGSRSSELWFSAPVSSELRFYALVACGLQFSGLRFGALLSCEPWFSAPQSCVLLFFALLFCAVFSVFPADGLSA